MYERNRGGGIRRLRVRAGLTQEEMAGLTGTDEKTEMAVETVGRHERGVRNADETYQRLKNALHGQEKYSSMPADEFTRLVNYEAGIAHIVTDAILACEEQGIPIIEQILGRDLKKNAQPPGDAANEAKGGIPLRVVQCAEALEKRIEDSVGNDRALGKALAPDLLKFKDHSINARNGFSTAQADALAQLVGALGVGFIQPCSLDLSQSLLQVKGVESGWLMHLVFNTQRGHAVTFQFDWKTSPPTLLRPDCSFQIPQPDGANDKRSTDRKTLIQANRVAPGYTMGEEWEEESIVALDELDWKSAFFGVNQALLAREDSAHAPFADAPSGRFYGPYIKHLHVGHRLPDLKVIKVVTKRSSVVLKTGVTELHVHSFFQNCLQAIKEVRLADDVDTWLQNQDVDKVIARLLAELHDRDDLQQSDEALKGLEDVHASADRNGALRDWLVTWGGRASQAGSHVRNFETIGGWIMETLGMGVA